MISSRPLICCRVKGGVFSGHSLQLTINNINRQIDSRVRIFRLLWYELCLGSIKRYQIFCFMSLPRSLNFMHLEQIKTLEKLYEQYLKDPESVDPSWRYFFEGVAFGSDQT